MSTIQRILICDDSITVRKKLSQALSTIRSFDIYEAENGNVVISTYDNVKPDLVFMDIVMPEKDGIQAVREIVTKDDKAKIIMLSSVGTSGNLKDALEAGALDFIQKPWDNLMLKNAITKLESKE